MSGAGAHLTSKARGTYRDDWGTPDEILHTVRELYGRISIDLASSDEANKRVNATCYYTLELPAIDPPLCKGSVVYCNPPGPSTEVKRFWGIWCFCLARGAVGAFLVFNLDHLRMLPAPPVECLVWFPRHRLRFVGAPSTAAFSSSLVMSIPPGLPPSAFSHLPGAVMWWGHG